MINIFGSGSDPTTRLRVRHFGIYTVDISGDDTHFPDPTKHSDPEPTKHSDPDPTKHSDPDPTQTLGSEAATLVFMQLISLEMIHIFRIRPNTRIRIRT